MDTGLADACDTCLVLGLGYEGQSNHSANRHHAGDPKLDQPRSNPMPLEPSLTLSLPDDAYTSTLAKLDKSKESADASLARQSSVQSTISSFSGIKREKDAGCEEVEAERVSRASDEEEDGCARKKLRLTKEQSALLEDKFNAHTTLNPKQKQALATQLNLRPRQVEVWFQNRRARTKLKQTEVDCEVLKKCCETLTDENRRLQKELQELRTIKFAAPLYMHLPTAAITMCPSCKKIGSIDNGSKSSPFVAAQKRQFLGPFPHSAAC